MLIEKYTPTWVQQFEHLKREAGEAEQTGHLLFLGPNTTLLVFSAIYLVSNA